MDIFLCDIVGTFTGNENRSEELRKLAKNLTKIADIDDVSVLSFSFISSCHSNQVNEYVKELSKYIDDKRIIFGQQFSSQHKFIPGNDLQKCVAGKSSQILDIIKKEKNIKNIYYADDVSLFHDMIDNILEMTNFDYDNFIHIIPNSSNDNDNNIISSSSKGIIGLNNCLNSIIKKNINNTKYNLIKKKYII